MARVAGKSSILFLFVLVVGTALAQKPATTVTLHARAQTLGAVIEQLGAITGLNFVYSSDKIDVTQLISLYATDLSIDEVLLRIGSKTNLTFKQQERYVIVKVNPPKATTTVSEPSPLPAESAPTPRHMPVRTARLMASLDEQHRSTRDLGRFSPDMSRYFGTTHRTLPIAPLSLNHSAHRPLWFVAVGPIINEYSAGVGFQIGTPTLYFLTDLAVLSNRELIPGYGLGTEIRWTEQFRLRPMYTFSNYRRFDNSLSYASDGRLVSTNTTSDARYHKLKLMVQYAVAGRITLSAGPTLNHLRTEFSSTGLYPGGSYRIGDSRRNSTTSLVPDGLARVNKSWLGWEASISYRLTFQGK